MKKRKIVTAVFLVLIFTSFAFAETYDEWLQTCKDYKDVALWLEKNFKYDFKRLEEAARAWPREAQKVYSPEETFKLKSGVCHDSSVFGKYSLNKINPGYKAEIIFLMGPGFVHHVTGFYLDGQLWIMDYGYGSEKFKHMLGTYGPFKSLDQYAKDHYLKNHPTLRFLSNYHFGWPLIGRSREINSQW